MAMVDPEEFADKEVAMVYIAGRLGEGKRVEQILCENAIDYFVTSNGSRPICSASCLPSTKVWDSTFCQGKRLSAGVPCAKRV